MQKHSYIEQIILEQIQRGGFFPGERIPAVRKLAAQYQMSITPVIEAYQHLVERGILEHRPNTGYFVAKLPQTAPNQISRAELLQAGVFNYRIHFQNNTTTEFRYLWGATAISTGLFEADKINQAVAREFRCGVPPHNPQSEIADNTALLKHIVKLMVMAGCSPGSEEIILTPSATDAIQYALQVCTRENNLIAVEAPGHNGFYFIAAALNLRIIRVPSDPETGLRIDRFQEMLQLGLSPACLLLSSTFSSPTGALMPDENKRALVSLCQTYQIPIIEDDVLGELYYGTDRPQPLKAFDAENVIYISGFGKLYAPSLRIGWMAGGRFQEQLLVQKSLLAGFPPSEIQQAMSAFLDTKSSTAHLVQMRAHCRTLSQQYCQIIRDRFPPGTAVYQPSGGIFLWVRLPEAYDAAELCYTLQEQGIFLLPGQLFGAVGDEFKNCIRLNILAVPWTESSRHSLAKMGDFFCSYRNRG